ncbi:hypothetical protein JVT61DRAFT_14314 [Boletus reticuloceps]|uniref:BTB domain-containing protein n=1 Tax=Boletus reticuloceps TaxID=495285 RepID=A0A8I3A304_9AGAM|nr:hypothetical protein JVT61DRAFT_14314 [Boletus reticuloceps]
MTKQPTVDLEFEGGTMGTSDASGKQPPTTGTSTGPRAFTGNPAFGKPQQQQPSLSAFGEPKPGSTLAQPDHRKLECLEELARKCLLGEELVNTRLYLFSAKSFSSGRVMKPRALCANNALLAKSSKYFMDLLSGGINSPDPLLVNLMGDYDVPNNALIVDYGYESDSDLDECDEPLPVVNPEVSTEQSVSGDSDA